MENKSHALLAGLFTIFLVAAAIYGAMWFNRDQVNLVPYEIATKLSVPGLTPQAAVRYRGLDIGRVDAIGFDPDQPGTILVRIGVRPDTPITSSTFATLGYQGVTGIAYIQLDDTNIETEPLQTSAAKPGRITLKPSLFDELQARGLAIMEQTEEISRRINVMLSDDNQKAILGAFNSIDTAARALGSIPKQMQPTLERLPTLASQAEHTLATLDRVGSGAEQLAGNLDGFITELRSPEGALTAVAGSAARIGAVAAKLENETLPLANDVRSSLRTLNRTLNSLTDRPQGILFGAPDIAPGPGEDGFAAPGR